MKKSKTIKLIYGSICLALCLVLPFLTSGIPVIGKTLSPMHFPTLLCGFIAGPEIGATVGFFAPLIRNLLFGMPAPIYPRVIRMMIELAAYGFFAGFFNKFLPKKAFGVYISLISAMCLGRIAYGIATFLFSLVDKSQEFVFDAIVLSTVTNSVAGIIIDIIIVPPLVFAIWKITDQRR